MPQKNTNHWPTHKAKARRRPHPITTTTLQREPGPGALALDLVERGLASMAILGPITPDPRREAPNPQQAPNLNDRLRELRSHGH